MSLDSQLDWTGFFMSNGENSWGVGYSEIMFFSQVLHSHTAVASFTRSKDIVFDIVRLANTSPLRVLLLSEYRLGESAAYKALQDFSDIQVIVNNGNWNAVVLNKIDFKKQTGIHVMEVRNFLGALNDPAFG